MPPLKIRHMELLVNQGLCQLLFVLERSPVQRDRLELTVSMFIESRAPLPLAP